jgi:hypothetical protein
MTGAGGFAAEPVALAAAATAFDGSARRIADGAPQPASLSADAFGLIGQVFAGAASAAAGQGMAALERVRGELATSAERLRATAAEYRAADERAATLLARAAQAPR